MRWQHLVRADCPLPESLAQCLPIALEHATGQLLFEARDLARPAAKFFFDNNLPPRIAHAIGELSTKSPGVDKLVHRSQTSTLAMPPTLYGAPD